MEKIVINIHGPMCAGKTTVANMLHSKMPRTFIISGDRIKWFISDYTASNDRETVVEMVFNMVREALTANLNVIKDSNYMLWEESGMPQKYRDLFQKENAKVFQFNLEAPRPILLERLAERVKRSEALGKKISIKTEEAFQKMYEYYLADRKPELETFDTSQVAPEHIVDAILSRIKNA